VEGDADKSSQGAKRAIPAEHVLAVFEIKSRLTRNSLREALAKLTEITEFGYFSTNADSTDKCRKQFFCAPVFFEFRSEDASKVSALDALREFPQELHMLAPVILRYNDGDASDTGRFFYKIGNGVERTSGVRVYPRYDPFIHRLQDVTELHILWIPHQFQWFAFEVLDRLAGRPSTWARSYYAMPPMIEIGENVSQSTR
jgi:hypothetical protein